MKEAGPPAVRRASLADAAAVADLAAATFVETFGHLYPPEDLETFLATAKTQEAYAQVLDDPSILVRLAESQQGEPVGYAVAGPCKLPLPDLEPSAGELRELYLLRSAQGHGLGTKLLEGALDWLQAEGHTPLYVGVWSENLGAQRLYGRYGFEKVGEYDFPVGTRLDREFILRRRN